MELHGRGQALEEALLSKPFVAKIKARKKIHGDVAPKATAAKKTKA